MTTARVHFQTVAGQCFESWNNIYPGFKCLQYRKILKFNIALLDFKEPLRSTVGVSSCTISELRAKRLFCCFNSWFSHRVGDQRAGQSDGSFLSAGNFVEQGRGCWLSPATAVLQGRLDAHVAKESSHLVLFPVPPPAVVHFSCCIAHLLNTSTVYGITVLFYYQYCKRFKW